MGCKATIYTDGACFGNPGRGGYAAIIELVDLETKKITKHKLSGGYRLTTNNRMELSAVLKAFQFVSPSIYQDWEEKGGQLEEVTFYTDSKHVSDAINEKWLLKWLETGKLRAMKNPDLWGQIVTELDFLGWENVKFNWIKGHSGHPENEIADELAKAAAGQCEDALCVDVVYEEQNPNQVNWVQQA